MLRIEPALTEPALSQVRALFREYATTPGVTPCMADFEREVASLPGPYAPPQGRLFLALRAHGASHAAIGEAAGCVALRGLGTEACEMKRLYVRPAFRGTGAGRSLVDKLITEARSIGYKKMRLDTLATMHEAHKLYKSLGFVEIPSYQKNPIAGALFFQLLL